VLDILNGRIHLILGNHDTPGKINLYEQTPNIIEIVTAKRFEYGKRHFYLSHYPTLTSNFDDNPRTAVYNIHGHTHSTEKFYNDLPYMYNVACDAQNCTPVSIDQIMDDIDYQLELYYE
jgi:calcineurin-like phosphoesterase family protein